MARDNEVKPLPLRQTTFEGNASIGRLDPWTWLINEWSFKWSQRNFQRKNPQTSSKLFSCVAYVMLSTWKRVNEAWNTLSFSFSYCRRKTDMKIIFQITKTHESESREMEIERTARVRFSANENDLVERQRYDFENFMKWLKSKKIKLSG